MHEHDLDLIASAASGLLDGEDERRAAESVASCGVCAAEATLQREIAGMLASTPPPRMTDLERARLHRRVAEGISTPAVERFGRRWVALGGVAAAALVLVGGFVTITNLLPGSTGAGDTAAVEMADGQDRAITSEGREGLAYDDLPPAVGTTAAATDAGGVMSGLVTSERDWLVDARQLSPATVTDILSDLSTAVVDPNATVDPGDAAAFGATCVAEVAGTIHALVLVSIDSVDHEVYFTGDRSDPTLIAFRSDGCVPVDAEGLTTGR